MFEKSLTKIIGSFVKVQKELEEFERAQARQIESLDQEVDRLTVKKESAASELERAARIRSKIEEVIS